MADEGKFEEISLLHVRTALSRIEDWCRGVREALQYFPGDLKVKVPAELLEGRKNTLPTLLYGCPPAIPHDPCDDDKKK